MIAQHHIETRDAPRNNVMGMSRNWRTIARFARSGLAISFASSLCLWAISAIGVMPAWMSVGMLLLSPGTLLLYTAMDIEQLTIRGYVFIWLFAGLLNFPLYAVVGAAFVGFKKLWHAAATH
jgi:hypothetical protein